jgi:hypothetical protein
METTFSGNSGKKVKIATAVIVLGVIFLIVGIILLAIGISKSKCDTSPTSTSQDEAFCKYSKEANRVGFGKFLDKVKRKYYELHPFNVFYDPDVSKATDQKGAAERVKAEYVAFDTTPSVIKDRTDTAWSLLDELNKLGIVEERLKPRERKSLAQARHYLKQVFGQPYDVNYYTADWMLGPDLFCYRQICYLGYGIYHATRYLKPNSSKDVELIEKKLKTNKDAVERYINNMKIGVKKGMIRNTESCVAGLNAMKRAYLNISLFNETGRCIEI